MGQAWPTLLLADEMCTTYVLDDGILPCTFGEAIQSIFQKQNLPKAKANLKAISSTRCISKGRLSLYSNRYNMPGVTDEPFLEAIRKAAHI